MMTETTWKTSDGLTIYAKQWTSAQPPKAVICLMHGMGEHIGRYDWLAEQLNQQGFDVLGCDQRGHGKSEGPRGHFPDFEIFMNDVDALLQAAQQRYPQVPRVLYGHSMGGNLVANYLLRRQPRQLAGAVLSSPYLQLAFQPSAVKLWMGRLMKGIWPGLSLDSGLDASGISRNVQVVETYLSDPLVHSKISAKMGIELIETGQWALDHAAELTVPTLVYHGNQDRLTSFEASRQFAEGSPMATFVAWEGLFHETHNEPEKDQVIAQLGAWLTARVGA
jgi:acylglycerol lipase